MTRDSDTDVESVASWVGEAPAAHFQSAVYWKSESKWVAHSFAKLDLTALAAGGAIFGARRNQTATRVAWRRTHRRARRRVKTSAAHVGFSEGAKCVCCSLYVQCSLLHVSGAMFLAREWRTGHADCKPAFRADPSSATRRRQADDIDAPVAHFRSAVYRKSESKWVAHSFAKLDPY